MTSDTVCVAMLTYLVLRWVLFDAWLVHAAMIAGKNRDKENPPWRG